MMQLQSFKDKDYEKALIEVFKIMDEKVATDGVKEEMRKYALQAKQNPKEDISNTGSTSNVILITPDAIYCANTGDCRAILSRNKEVV